MLQTKTHVYFAKRIETHWIEANSLLVNLQQQCKKQYPFNTNK